MINPEPVVNRLIRLNITALKMYVSIPTSTVMRGSIGKKFQTDSWNPEHTHPFARFQRFQRCLLR